ncbi:hypothetical protein H6G80_33420 [Nostoc sp. FACHB-87]|uniref:hypothetical protein n=1 Tax=Nostocales TaxID=1161 RepID=UPI00168375CA|nr:MULTISPECIES: hypothetical protein [Nostocales]MBD2458939.1 hypothetical protein [Nostoc sp. FACHB-87]MBD2479929.1 hypothetical protein [Anabaena sp. FACHB-83]MBD2491781.1 hypothetical protein [Aulosira sp. FACHB-615]
MYDWQYFFKSDRTNLNQVSYRIFEPEWKADILHWFSREDVDKQQKEDFIQALIDFDDGCGGFYRYRAYFLAAEAIAKFPESSLADRIVEQLLKWSYGYFRQDKRDWQILPQPLVERARKTLELTDRKKVVAAFVHLVHTTESRTIMRLAAEKLGKLDPGNKSAIAALALMPIAEDEPEPTFCQISQTFRQISVLDETAIATLSEQLQNAQSDIECLQMARSLLEADSSNQIAINALFKLVNNLGQSPKYPDDAQYIAWQATICLVQIDPTYELVINALIQLIRTAKEHSYLSIAVKYLGSIGLGNKAVLVTLTELITSTQDYYLLCYAVESLEKIDPGNKIGITTLIEKIEKVQDEFCLKKAACLIGKLDPGNKLAISTLSQLLQNTQDESFKLYIAKSLAKIDPGNPQAIFTLCTTPENHLHQILLMTSIQNLEQLNASNILVKDKFNEIIPILIGYIQNFQTADDNQNYYNNLTSNLSYESYLLDIADSLNKILPVEYLPQVLTSLKDYLNQKFYKNSSYRYEAVLKIIWHCAENLKYPEFYQLWHS